MKRLSRVLQDYRDTGPMSTLINLYGFVDDGVFLTKGGDLGVVLALGVAGNLGADHALRVGLPGGAAHPADRRRVEPLDRQRAGARAIMWADAVGDIERQEVLP